MLIWVVFLRNFSFDDIFFAAYSNEERAKEVVEILEKKIRNNEDLYGNLWFNAWEKAVPLQD